MNWTEILSNAGVPDSPGFAEALADCRANPYVKAKRKPKAKAQGKKKYPGLKHGAD